MVRQARHDARVSPVAGLTRFHSLPREHVVDALTDILDAHVAVAAAGMVAVDLYDGCLLYDFVGHRMRLIDLDEYRPGPFVVERERVPGSSRYMAPEEFVHGEVIDERSMVFTLGRTIWNLLEAPAGWRGTPGHATIVATATNRDRTLRFGSVAQLADEWRHANDEFSQDVRCVGLQRGRTGGLALGRGRG
jgi:serine/threonine-protein kinase